MTYQTTAQDAATVVVGWRFRGTDSWPCASARAAVFAHGPNGVNEVLVNSAGGGSYSSSGTITIRVRQDLAFGVLP